MWRRESHGNLVRGGEVGEQRGLVVRNERASERDRERERERERESARARARERERERLWICEVRWC